MTPVAILVAAMLGYLAFVRYLRQGRGGQSTVISVGSSDAVAQNGGYVFFDVADEHKALFADAMNGFGDFAKLKGYSVELSFDTSLPGKVGIRFTIVDSGVTVSTATVRKDVDEYIDRLRSSDDLSDMPMATNSVEHVRLASALQSRFSYLRAQAEMFAIQIEFYKRLMDEWKARPSGGIGYTSPVQIHLTNEGSRNMRDSYNAENSQNVAQGKQARALTKDSTVLIGSTLTEKNKQVSSLKKLEGEIRQAELPPTTKEAALKEGEGRCCAISATTLSAVRYAMPIGLPGMLSRIRIRAIV
jgi:hypothetical protein